MAHETNAILVSLDTLQWEWEIVATGGGGFGGDDIPSIDPFMWSVFFKIDGTTVQVVDTPSGLTLQGSATVITTPGSHGNLNAGTVVPGDSTAIPEAIGLWIDRVVPIPMPLAWRPLIPDTAAYFGVVLVLMAETGNISDSSIEAGHRALNDGVQSALDQLIRTWTMSAPPITNDLSAGIGTSISTAVQNAMGFWETLAAAIFGPDWQVGQQIFQWTQDQFSGADGTLAFNPYWTSTGWWGGKIAGSMCIATACPAEAVALALDQPTGGAMRDAVSEPGAFRPEYWGGIDALRAFRDNVRTTNVPGLAQVWQIAQGHSAELAMLARRNHQLRTEFAASLSGMGALVGDLDKELPTQFIASAERVLRMLAAEGSRRLSRDARKGLRLVARVRSSTLRQAMAAAESGELPQKG